MKKTLTLLPLLALITLLVVAASMPKYVGRFYGDGVGLTNVAATNVISGGQLPTSVIPSPLWTNAATFVLKTNAANGAWFGVVPDVGVVKSNAVTGKYSEIGTNAAITSTAASNYFAGGITALGGVTASNNADYALKTTGSYGLQTGGGAIHVGGGSIFGAAAIGNASLQFVLQGTPYVFQYWNGAAYDNIATTSASNWNFSGSIYATNGIVLPRSNSVVKFLTESPAMPPASGAGTAFIYAQTNGAGTAEIFTMDGAGVSKQISEHAMDAPTALIDDADEAPNISKEILRYTGKVRWINRSRAARLQEREMKVLLNSLSSYQFLTGKTPTQWTNSNAFGQYTNNLMVLDAMSAADRQVVIVETFAEYNTRNGFTTNSPLYLVKSDWTADQDRFQAEYAASYTNAVNAALANTNAIAPIWNPPAVQPLPAWLYKRGVR